MWIYKRECVFLFELERCFANSPLGKYGHITQIKHFGIIKRLLKVLKRDNGDGGGGGGGVNIAKQNFN